MDSVIYEKKGNVVYLTLNRPDRLNAVNQKMSHELIECLDIFKNDSEARVLILTGAGERAFCAGVDLKEAAENQGNWLNSSSRGKMFEAVIETWKPVICAINGAAVGAGCELALASDIRIASDNSRIGLPEAKRGMGSSFGSIVLPRMISPAAAAQILYTGRILTVEEAYSVGLVNEVVPSESLLRRAEGIAHEICSCAPLSVQRMKENVWKTMGIPLFQALHLDIGPNVYESEDRVEGAKAFFEKRPPVWKGR